jgi:predicted nucleic acid-binding protein
LSVCLIDTSVLGRIANDSDAQQSLALRAISILESARDELVIAPQNLIEFRNFATRAVQVNGLGFAIADAVAQAEDFERAFRLLPETPEIYSQWKTVVETYSVIGKQVHDARLVAICRVYGIGTILTFNVQHFNRLAGSDGALVVRHPADVVSGGSTSSPWPRSSNEALARAASCGQAGRYDRLNAGGFTRKSTLREPWTATVSVSRCAPGGNFMQRKCVLFAPLSFSE